MSYSPTIQFKDFFKTSILLTLLTVLTFFGACCVWGQDYDQTNHLVHHNASTIITVDCSGTGANQCNQAQIQEHVALTRSDTELKKESDTPDKTNNTIALITVDQWVSAGNIPKVQRFIPTSVQLSFSRDKTFIQQLPRSHLG